MESIGRAIPGALTELLRDAPLSPGKVTFAWRAAVGPALQRATAVRLEGTGLLVEAASAEWAREVGRAATVILPRLQLLLGSQSITRIDVRGPATDQARRRRPRAQPTSPGTRRS
jgi:hypothetical protein